MRTLQGPTTQSEALPFMAMAIVIVVVDVLVAPHWLATGQERGRPILSCFLESLSAAVRHAEHQTLNTKP